MSSNTVAEFASELKKSPDTLLEQLHSAGVDKSAPTDALTENDKQKLLSYLQASHGTVAGERKKITLVKKSTSEIKQADATGKARTIQVEVRKKRTFIKRDDEVETTPIEPVEPAAPLIDHAELAKREEEARSQAELLRRQEEELAEKRREREAKELAKREEAKAKQASETDDAAVAKSPEELAAQAAAIRSAKAAAAQHEADSINAASKPVDPSIAQSAENDRVKAEALVKADKAAKIKAAEDQADADAKAVIEDEAVRERDLNQRRNKALAEAEAIRAMMSGPAKKAPPKEVPKVDPKAAKGTLHKPAQVPGAVSKKAAATTEVKDAAPGGNKEVKSAKLSSSWAGDPAKKKAIPTRGDTSGGVGRNNWRGGPKNRRGNERDREEQVQAAPAEARVIEVHVPETITVAELAHKMAIKASEVIKQLMKLGQMVTINQPLDQDTAMILVEELGQ